MRVMASSGPKGPIVSNYKPRIYEVFLDISEILGSPILKSVRLWPEIILRMKDMEHTLVFHAPETTIGVRLEKINPKAKRTKYRISVTVNWPSSTYHPINAVSCADQHRRAAMLALRAHVVAAGWEYTKKECEAAWSEYERWKKLEEL